ncbi:MAG: hypothetical protein WD941_03620 [Opitutus sp.]
MKGRRVKFVWGASRVIQGRWHLGLIGIYERRPGVPDSGLAISVRGLLVAFVALVLAAYIGAASILYWIWQRNGFIELGLADALLYPIRRQEVSAAKGRTFLVRGKELFRTGKYLDAATLLRHGLARQPRDFVARRQLAQFYLMANQRPLALKVLQDGLGPEYPGRTYLELLFEAADQGEGYDLIVTTCTGYAAALKEAEADRDRRWLAGRKFGALIAGGRGEDALAFAEELDDGAQAREFRVLALLALHRAADALRRLDEWPAGAGAEAQVVLRLRVRALGEAGRIDEMERAVAQLHGMAPSEPNALAYGVVQLALASRDDVAARAFENYLFRFGGSPANIAMLADPLAEIGHLPLLQRCVDAATERGYPQGRLQMQVVQTLLQRGEWAPAASLLEGIEPARDRGAAVTQAWREWVRRVLDAAMDSGESAQLPLIELLRSRAWPMQIVRQSIEAMLQAERFETAREIATVGTRAFPESEWLRVTMDTVRQRIEARQAAAPVTDATEGPIMERAFFQELLQIIDARRWDDVSKMIREVRAARPMPVWLDRRDAELWLVQMRSAQGRGDRSALISAARMYLLGGSNRAGAMLELGREFNSAGDKPSAVVLVKQILQRFPDYPPAKRQLAEWTPAPEADAVPER